MPTLHQAVGSRLCIIFKMDRQVFGLNHKLETQAIRLCKPGVYENSFQDQQCMQTSSEVYVPAFSVGRNLESES